MAERRNSWWESTVGEAAALWRQKNPELKEFLLSLHLERQGGKLLADTPDGRREVQFSTISGKPVVAYVKEVDPNNTPILSCVAIPSLPWHEITRGGIPSKVAWEEAGKENEDNG